MATYTLFAQPSSPATLISDTDSYTLGMQFSLSSSAALSGIWFHSATGASALPAACAIYDVTSNTIVSGTANTSPTWSAAAGSGWVKCDYDGSVTLNASQNYKVVVQHDSGTNWYSATAHYWDTGTGSAGLTSGIISAPSNAGGDGGQNTFVNPSSSLSYPSSSFNANNYWIDVEVTTSGGGGGGSGSTQGSPMALLF